MLGLSEYANVSGQWETFNRVSSGSGKNVPVVPDECERRGLEQMRVWEGWGSVRCA